MNPNHKPFVVTESGQQVLYVQLIKAIYGCVKLALLWYKLFSTSLKEMGFVLRFVLIERIGRKWAHAPIACATKPFFRGRKHFAPKMEQ
jgi:hypothetical protein